MHMRVCARGGGQSADEVGARADLADGGGGPLGLKWSAYRLVAIDASTVARTLAAYNIAK